MHFFTKLFGVGWSGICESRKRERERERERPVGVVSCGAYFCCCCCDGTYIRPVS